MKAILRMVKRYYFLLFLIVASFVYGASYYSIPLPSFVTSYVNDFLCLPIICKIGQSVLQMVTRQKDLHVPWQPLLLLIIFYAVYFEWYLPGIRMRYTSDYVDVILYFLGGMFFYGIERTSLSEKRINIELI